MIPINPLVGDGTAALAQAAVTISNNQLAEILITMGGALALILIFIMIFSQVVRPTRSREYRSLMADLFVIGTIKNLAAEDKIDLVQELKDFRKAEKIRKMKYKELDEQIEAELKEKVSAKINPEEKHTK